MKPTDEDASQACVEWWLALPVAEQQNWLGSPQTLTKGEAWRERQRRQEAVDFSRATVGLEGFTPSPECEALFLRFINGESKSPKCSETFKNSRSTCAEPVLRSRLGKP